MEIERPQGNLDRKVITWREGPVWIGPILLHRTTLFQRKLESKKILVSKNRELRNVMSLNSSQGKSVGSFLILSVFWQNSKRLKFENLSNPGTLNLTALRSTSQGRNLDCKSSFSYLCLQDTGRNWREKLGGGRRSPRLLTGIIIIIRSLQNTGLFSAKK